MSQCTNARCTNRARWRVYPYGRKHRETFVCSPHLTLTLNALLHLYRGPLLVYRTGDR